MINKQFELVNSQPSAERQLPSTLNRRSTFSPKITSTDEANSIVKQPRIRHLYIWPKKKMNTGDKCHVTTMSTMHRSKRIDNNGQEDFYLCRSLTVNMLTTDHHTFHLKSRNKTDTRFRLKANLILSAFKFLTQEFILHNISRARCANVTERNKIHSSTYCSHWVPRYQFH